MLKCWYKLRDSVLAKNDIWFLLFFWPCNNNVNCVMFPWCYNQKALYNCHKPCQMLDPPGKFTYMRYKNLVKWMNFVEYTIQYLRVPYLWYVRTKTKVNIVCDENIRSPQPYITPSGTAFWTKTLIKCYFMSYFRPTKICKNMLIKLTVNQEYFKNILWRRNLGELGALIEKFDIPGRNQYMAKKNATTKKPKPKRPENLTSRQW